MKTRITCVTLLAAIVGGVAAMHASLAQGIVAKETSRTPVSREE